MAYNTKNEALVGAGLVPTNIVMGTPVVTTTTGTVNIKFYDFNGNLITNDVVVDVYTSDVDGLATDGTAAMAVKATTGKGTFIAETIANTWSKFKTEDGELDVVITDSGAEEHYLNVVCSSAVPAVSTIMTFEA